MGIKDKTQLKLKGKTRELAETAVTEQGKRHWRSTDEERKPEKANAELCHDILGRYIQAAENLS